MLCLSFLRSVDFAGLASCLTFLASQPEPGRERLRKRLAKGVDQSYLVSTSSQPWTKPISILITFSFSEKEVSGYQNWQSGQVLWCCRNCSRKSTHTFCSSLGGLINWNLVRWGLLSNSWTVRQTSCCHQNASRSRKSFFAVIDINLLMSGMPARQPRSQRADEFRLTYVQYSCSIVCSS